MMSDLSLLREHVDNKGFSMVRSAVSESAVTTWQEQLGKTTGAGRRGLLAVDAVRSLALSENWLGWAQAVLPGVARPVRAIFFDKTPETNWLVTWHQDLTIAVQHRVETPDYGPWSVKDGIPHVQPPAACLEQMITLRLHLDLADEENGALRVLPGSHRMGRLSSAGIQAWRASHEEHLCRADAGDLLLMRPLLLHASGRSTSTRRRRVLHIEYASFDLPAGLSWGEGE